MGLKIRRLKNGFAYYGEYKFGSGTGRQSCIYERVEAGSLREAKRRYAARRKELLAQLQGDVPDAAERDDGRPITVRESGARGIDAVLASILRVLALRAAFADPALGGFLRDVFRRMDRAPGAADALEICTRARGELLSRLAASAPAARPMPAVEAESAEDGRQVPN